MVLIRSALLLIAVAAAAGGACDAAGQESVLTRVDPMIGTGGHGHTYPGASVPFGMIQPGPDAGKSGWDWCSGYHYSDTALAGFSHTHLSGTGCGDLGDLLVLPAGVPGSSRTVVRVPFSHRDETASPGYYAVSLRESGIRVELTATSRAALHRYTFRPGDSALVAIKLGRGQDDVTTASSCTLQGDSVLAGYRFSTAGRRASASTSPSASPVPSSPSHTLITNRRSHPSAREPASPPSSDSRSSPGTRSSSRQASPR